MELIPAVDLRGGRVVRLRQGDFERQTVYGDDPAVVVDRWTGEGAERLHLVDLDGARAGRPSQWGLVAALVARARVPCQVAGGLRDDESVAAALAAGADRVVLGTRLITDPAWGRSLVLRHGPERIVAALDVRDGELLGDAWQPGAPRRDVIETVGALVEAGLGFFAVTAVARDGLLEGPDLELLARLAAVVGPAKIIASGGISSLEDLQDLADAGYGAAILGRALYDERISLRQALVQLRAATTD